MKELEYKSIQFKKALVCRVNDVFSDLTEEQITQSIDKVVDSEELEEKINLVSLFNVNTGTNDSDDFIAPDTKKTQVKNTIKNSLLSLFSVIKEVAANRVESSLFFYVRVFLTSQITHESVRNIFDVIKAPFITPDVAFHGYYAFFFSMLIDAMKDQFTAYRDKKRMLNIKQGESEMTGLFFGLINPRPRTKREEVKTIIDNQKRNSIQLYKLMKKHSNKIEQDTKKLQKSNKISPEEIIKMVIDFQYAYLKSILLANDSTAELLQLINIKMREVQ
jgi:hypothetical protein